MIRFKVGVLAIAACVVLWNPNAFAFGFATVTADDASLKSIEAANKSIEAANMAIEAANKAVEVAETAMNAAKLAQGAAKDAGESARVTAPLIDGMHQMKTAIDELQKTMNHKQEAKVVPAVEAALGETHRFADLVGTEAKSLKRRVEDLLAARKEMDRLFEDLRNLGVSNSAPASVSTAPTIRTSESPHLDMLLEMLIRLQLRMQRLEEHTNSQASAPTPGEKAFMAAKSGLKRPMDAKIEFEAARISNGYQTANLFITISAPLNGQRLMVNGTEVDIQSGSVQHIELEFRSSPTICDVRVMPSNGWPQPITLDTPHKRIVVEPGGDYLVDTSELKAVPVPTMLQQVAVAVQ